MIKQYECKCLDCHYKKNMPWDRGTLCPECKSVRFYPVIFIQEIPHSEWGAIKEGCRRTASQVAFQVKTLSPEIKKKIVIRITYIIFISIMVIISLYFLAQYRE